MSSRICIPENDLSKRFVLAEKGKNNILVICLNPSAANASKHDGTTSNIEKIAYVNGYDGWVLFNLSPERTPHPEDLNLLENIDLLNENLDKLKGLLDKNEFLIQNVWLAWGNNVALKEFPYLKKAAKSILELLKSYSLNCYCIKKTTKNHPFHPAAQGLNRYIGPVEKIRLIPFDINYYLNKVI